MQALWEVIRCKRSFSFKETKAMHNDRSNVLKVNTLYPDFEEMPKAGKSSLVKTNFSIYNLLAWILVRVLVAYHLPWKTGISGFDSQGN